MTNEHTDSVLIQQMEILKGDKTMTTTPDYNDGAIHWWGVNKTHTPEGLHPKTIVIILDCCNKGHVNQGRVSEFHWASISAFQVVKQHIEPRVWWANAYSNGMRSGLYNCKLEASDHCQPGGQTIRVVEHPESET
jgi:hypothetical protein